MPELVMKLLGSPRIEIDQKTVEVSSRKAAALLYYLMVEYGRPHQRDELAAMFWPDQDQSRARAYLRNSLWMLAQAGLEPWLEAGRETVALKPADTLDLTAFQEQAAAGQQHDHARETACPDCALQLEAAAALYSGGFLSGFSLEDCPAFDEWQLYQGESLLRQLAGVLERLVNFYEAQEQWQEGILHARRWVALDPLHEPAQRRLVRLYARSGKRSQALKQYETLRETLDEELGVPPEAESQQLYADVLARVVTARQPDQQPAFDLPRRGPANNLPAEVTRFIGREREIAEITRLLRPGDPDAAPVRLLTLTGPGGSGKTRLALKSAARLGEDYEDGVYFVGLTAVDHPERVAPAIAHALGLAETPGRSIPDTLKETLKTRKLLLVLDNFEHLIEAAPLVADLLAAAPGARVLATSREVLRIYGEQVYPVQPLALPSADDLAQPGDLLRSEAVQLFIDRARAVHPGFAAETADFSRIAEICARLDGLPLAIELAAARLRLFSLESLHGQIRDSLEILRGGPRDVHSRQRTLRATIDWSYNLLGEYERRLFAWMSIFNGGCTLEAFLRVCGGDDGAQALDGLQSLIEKSLVVQRKGADGEPRYEMLETISAYAREKLVAFGESESAAARHAGFYAALAAEAEAHLRGGSKILYWLDCLEGEHGNLRAALDWCLAGGDPLLGMQMAASLMLYWVRKDHPSEGDSYLRQALALSQDAPQVVQARLNFSAGWLAYFRQDMETCYAVYQKAADLYRGELEPGEQGWALVFYGGTMGMLFPARYDEAVGRIAEGIQILRASGDKARIAQALNYIGEMARVRGDYRKARDVYEECLTLSREIGDAMREMMILQNLGFVAMHDEDFQQAEVLLREGLQIAQRIHSISQFGLIVMALGGLHAAQQQARDGARLMGAAQALLDAHGLVLQPADLMEIARYQSAMQMQLGTAAYDAAVEEGRALTLEEMIALALD